MNKLILSLFIILVLSNLCYASFPVSLDLEGKIIEFNQSPKNYSLQYVLYFVLTAFFGLAMLFSSVSALSDPAREMSYFVLILIGLVGVFLSLCSVYFGKIAWKHDVFSKNAMKVFLILSSSFLFILLLFGIIFSGVFASD